jgi:hypothetical protein
LLIRTATIGVVAVLIHAVGGPAAGAATHRLFIKARSNGRVVTVGGFHPSRDPSVSAAVKTFRAVDGEHEKYGGTACDIHWARFGLTITFGDLSGENNACNVGRADTAVIKGEGPESQRWSTANGLRLGDSVARLRKLYPRAAQHGASWWLVSSVSQIGISCYPSGCPYPVLRAKTTRGRVTSFRLSIGEAGE